MVSWLPKKLSKLKKSSILINNLEIIGRKRVPNLAEFTVAECIMPRLSSFSLHTR